MSKVARKPAGLTLIELMVSFVIILLVALYLMSLFASGLSHWKRAQQYSIATFLVQEKMQEEMQVPVANLTTGLGNFTSPFSEYAYRVDLIPYDSNLYTLDIEVTSNAGSVAQAKTLIGGSFTGFQGVSVDPFTNQVAFTNYSDLKIDSDVIPSTIYGVTYADSRHGGGLGGFPGSNLMWQIGQSQGLDKFTETSEVWNAEAGLSAVTSAAPRFGAVASDRWGNVALVGDTSNHCLWEFRDPSWVTKPLAPVTTALGIPSGIVTDPYANLVWVADQDNQCLRKFIFTSVSPGANYEANGTQGYWSLTQYRPLPPMELGAPQGIAMDQQGYAVYVVDRARLYRMIEDPVNPLNSEWKVLGAFNPSIINEGISGLAMDEYTSVFYVNTFQGSCYKFNVPASPVATLSTDHVMP